MFIIGGEGLPSFALPGRIDGDIMNYSELTSGKSPSLAVLPPSSEMPLMGEVLPSFMVSWCCCW